MGARNVAGYGVLYEGGRYAGLAHRAIMGEPDGDVLHRCDTPQCFNPGHLYVGSDKDNARDRMTAGNYRTRLPRADRDRLALLVADPDLTVAKVAEMVGCSPATVARARRRLREAGVPVVRRGRGQSLSPEQLSAIRLDPRSARAVAADYGVSAMTISRARR